MDFKEQLMNFQHYDIVAICLFVFVLIASGIIQYIKKQVKLEIKTRKHYPELIEIYFDYFPNRAVFNFFGHILADEPLFRAPRIRFPWQFRIGYPLGILNGTIVLTGCVLAGTLISFYYVLQQQFPIKWFIVILVFTILGFLLQTCLKKILQERIAEMDGRIDQFLASRSLTRQDVFIPIVSSSAFINKATIGTIWCAFVGIGFFILFKIFGPTV